MTIEDSLKGCKELKTAEKARLLAKKLAREAIFGEEVMKQCTPEGTKQLPVLLKEEMFFSEASFPAVPQFWYSPAEFEKLWKTKCWLAVEQACR